MCESEKLSIVISSLKDGFDLAVYDFINDKAIIKDSDMVMFRCDICFNDNKAFFINIEQKEENYLIAADII